MIYSVCGKLVLVNEGFVVVDVHGVGYQVFIPEPVFGRLPAIGMDVLFYVVHYIREDQQTLYGFLTQEDRHFFNLLTTVTGVGPKLAMTILSYLPTKDLMIAIMEEDTDRLSKISGLGAKKALRLVLELKDKLPKLFVISQSESTHRVDRMQLGALQTDLTLGLKSLGYSQDEIKTALKRAENLLKPDMSLEDGIKILLRNL